MTECSACGSTDVAVRMGKNGKPYLIDTRRPHFCPKRPKNGAKPARAKRDKDSPSEQAVEVLTAKPLQFKATEARKMVGAVITAGKAVDEIVRAALKRKGE